MKQRNTNIELLRIILAIFVIMWHVAVKINVNNSQPYKEIYSFAILQPLLSSPVVTFMLITGYFMANSSKNKSKNYLLNLGYYYLWSLICIILLASFDFIPWTRNNNSMPIDKYALGLMLSGGGNWWYAISLILIYALAPVLNPWLRAINSWKYEIFIIILLFILVTNNNFIFTISDSTANHPGSFTGIGSLNYARWTLMLVLMYLIGGFLNRYCKVIFQVKFLPIYIGFIILSSLLTTFEFRDFYQTNLIFGRQLYTDHCDIVMPFMAISIFAIFNIMKIKNFKIINQASKLSFPMYLFHYVWITFYSKFMFINFQSLEAEYWLISLFVVTATLIQSIVIHLIRAGIMKIYLKKWNNKVVVENPEMN